MVKKFGLEVLTVKRCLFDINLSMKPGEKFFVYKCKLSLALERFSYDLEMKTREQNRNNKRTEIERFDWCMKRIQTHLGFGWLSERAGKQTSCPKNFLEISLTSYCNTIGQSNNAFSILGFLWRENEEAMF